MGQDLPKQFIELLGKPVLLHTLENLSRILQAEKTIVVMHPDWIAHWRSLCDAHKAPPHEVIAGGEQRFHSVRNGLELLNEEGLVAIHDAVRPFASKETVLGCLEAAKAHGAAIPVTPLSDSLRQVNASGSVAIDRSEIRAVQTPQCFELGALKAAYQAPYSTAFTDDASVVEAMGQKVHLVDGNPENIKLTRPIDLLIAEALLKQGHSAL